MRTRPLLAPALWALVACRARHAATAPDGAASAAATRDERPPSTEPGGAVVPVRAAESSQPRWRYLARGPRPRGRERWRFDLTPRDAYGEPATDGRTVYVSAARQDPEGPSDGEVYAFDLAEGTLRWHTPVGGLHGEPVEYLDGVVLVDTIAHCRRRGPETPGVTARPCEEGAPGAVVGLDAATGRERFRTAAASESLRARWTAAQVGASVWVHDGLAALRPLALPAGAPGPRLALRGSVLNVTAVGGDALYTLWPQAGGTRLVRRAAGQPRPRWERALPFRTHCPPSWSGAVLVLPAFQASAVTGAPRGLHAADGADAWSAPSPPERVGTCGAVENGVHFQVYDDALEGLGVLDGRRRARHGLPVALTGDMAALMDGVFYVSARGRLAGLDVIGGHVSVSVETGAEAAEGVVVWGGRGAVATRGPGLVVGFD